MSGRPATALDHETEEDIAADALLAGDYEVDEPSQRDPEKDVEPHDRGDLDDSVLDAAEHSHQPLAGKTHEHSAHLLFHDPELDDGLKPFFALVSEFEPAKKDDDGNLLMPALAGVESFDAAGSTWAIDRRSDHPNPDDYDKATVRYWQGGIATRPQDAGETYYEYQIPVYDTDDAEKRNRRITFQFRPSLPNAETEEGKSIQSMPDDLPLGIRVEVKASNVETQDVTPILRGLADALGLRPDYFDDDHIHPWSTVYGFALYVRLRRELADETLIGEGGLLERLAVFGSRRSGRGEQKWNNEDVMGKRTAVAMTPTNLNHLYPGHVIGKLLKSYLTKHPRGDPRDPDEEPTDHPKLEVQWNRDHTPGDRTVRWCDEHADEPDQYGRHEVLAELRSYLLNALDWAGLPTTPDENVFVTDDHFQARPLTDQDAIHRLDRVGSPLDDLETAERRVVTKTLIEEQPTDGELDVLRASTDGGHFEGVAQLADAADRSTSTVSRTLAKFGRLFERLDGITVADSIIRDRLGELFATLDSAIDHVDRGISHLGSADTPVNDDSAFGRWAARYGVSLSDGYDGLTMKIAAGQFSTYELHILLRNGYQAARDTLGLDEHRFLDAAVEYHDADGSPSSLDRVAVWHGSSLKIRGHEDVFALD